jgi:serine/threonine protein kinase
MLDLADKLLPTEDRNQEIRLASAYDFELSELIAEGQQALVYRGAHVPTQTPVAVKAAKRGWERQIENEASLLGSLQHPNIMPVLYQSLPYSRDAFFVMPILTELARLPRSERLAALAGVAEGLDYAHEAGIVHGDIKATNLLVSDEGGGVLADFGVARAVGDTQTPRFVGSPDYTAPEVLRGANYSPQSDIYSFAVAVNRVLFEVFPSSNGSTVPAIQRGMSQAPEDRFDTATDLVYGLANDLQRQEATGHVAAIGGILLPAGGIA